MRAYPAQRPVDPSTITHGALDALDADDHPHYLDAARGDVRYPQQTHSHEIADVNQLSGTLADKVALAGTQTISGAKTFTAAQTQFNNDVVIKGDAFVEGQFNAVSSNDVNIGDRIITLNSELTGSPSLDAGIEVNRGNQSDAQLLWDESLDAWVGGIIGALKELATAEYVNAQLANKEPAFSKNSAFNKNFGNSSGTVTQGNDARLSNARAPTAHDHTKSDITDYDAQPTNEPRFTGDMIITHPNVCEFVLRSGDASLGGRLFFERGPNNETALEINAFDDLLRFEFTDTQAIQTSMEMTPSAVHFNREVRCAVQASNGDGLVTKDQVAAAYLSRLTAFDQAINSKLTINGELVISEPAGKAPIIRFFENNSEEGYLYIDNDNVQMVKTRATGAWNTFKMHETYSEFNKPVLGIDSSTPESFTTRGYVDDNLAPLNSPDFINDINVDGDINVTSDLETYLNLDTTTKVNNTLINFSNEGKRGALIYRNGPGTSGSDEGLLRIRRYDTITNALTAELRLGTSVVTNVPIFAPDGTSNSALTTQGFVKGLVDNVTKGITDFTGNLLIAIASGNVSLQLKSGSDVRMGLFGLTNYNILRRSASGSTATEMRMYNTYTTFNCEVRADVQGTLDESLTRRDYVNDNFLSTAGGTQSVNGDKTFNDRVTVDGILTAESNAQVIGDLTIGNGTADNVNPILTIDSGSTGNGQLYFRRASALVGIILGLSNRLELRHYANGVITSTLKLFDQDAVFNVPVRGVDDDHPDSYVTRDYVDALEARIVALENA